MTRVRWKPLLLSIVPGLGHFYYRRFAVGAGLFVTFATALNGLLLLSLLDGDVGRPLGWFCAALALAVWGYSVGWVGRHVLFDDPAAIERARAQLLREGLIHLLRSEYTDAVRCFRRANGVGPEAVCIDALFYLGAAYRRLGEIGRARRWLRRCAAWDAEGKWRFELGREMAAIEGEEAGAGPAATERGSAPTPIRLPLKSWAAGETSGSSPRLGGGNGA